MAQLLLHNGQLVDPEAGTEERGSLLIQDGRIRAALGPEEPAPPDAEWIDLEGRSVAPGFIDLHYHGAFIFEEPDRIAASLGAAGASLLRHGTTAFLPTTVAWPEPALAERVKKLCECVEAEIEESASPLGVHLEGPWIRLEAAGAQPDAGIRPYSAHEGRSLLDAAEGLVKMVTLAPEIPGAPDLQQELARRGIVAALGHSLADARVIDDGIKSGLRHVTHLFNAMGAAHHRDLGVAGVALTDDRLSCDLICDGVHVHPAFVRLAARAKGDRLMLITDRMEPGEGGFGSGAVRDDGDALRLPDGTLAGSNLTLERAVQNAVAFRALSRVEAVAACTSRPARLLGIEAERGTLRAGARADLVVLGAQGEVLETWLAGRRVHPAD